jgi:predicted small metal-binding protein
MGNIATCACGWTVISPLGAEDVKKHILIHLGDTHPGTNITEEEIRTLIKSV